MLQHDLMRSGSITIAVWLTGSGCEIGQKYAPVRGETKNIFSQSSVEDEQVLTFRLASAGDRLAVLMHGYVVIPKKGSTESPPEERVLTVGWID